MKVTLETDGGQAAAIRLGAPPEVVNTDTLPGNAAAELSQLVAAAVAAPEERRPGRAPDAMSYTITVEDGDRATVLTQSDAAMSPEFADLLSWLEKHLAQR
ncbi:protealysin inhibitor emfourin [Streptomyces sp. NPDC058301]|uniref:protealysin inhibitor emfourin n=1 Tax=Streptomyces sp. NPDC058301 TaxID=3346436 RepID=UPI0036E8FDC0